VLDGSGADHLNTKNSPVKLPPRKIVGNVQLDPIANANATNLTEIIEKSSSLPPSQGEQRRNLKNQALKPLHNQSRAMEVKFKATFKFDENNNIVNNNIEFTHSKNNKNIKLDRIS